MAKYPRYQGAGSSTINPYKIENAYDNLKENNLIFDYAKGYERIESENDKGLIKEAINVAKKNENLILAQINEENTLEQIKETKIGKYIYENQMKKMKKLLKEQNVNKATKIMMDLQKPLKKFYEK